MFAAVTLLSLHVSSVHWAALRLTLLWWLAAYSGAWYLADLEWWLSVIASLARKPSDQPSASLDLGSRDQPASLTASRGADRMPQARKSPPRHLQISRRITRPRVSAAAGSVTALRQSSGVVALSAVAQAEAQSCASA